MIRTLEKNVSKNQANETCIEAPGTISVRSASGALSRRLQPFRLGLGLSFRKITPIAHLSLGEDGIMGISDRHQLYASR